MVPTHPSSLLSMVAHAYAKASPCRRIEIDQLRNVNDRRDAQHGETIREASNSRSSILNEVELIAGNRVTVVRYRWKTRRTLLTCLEENSIKRTATLWKCAPDAIREWHSNECVQTFEAERRSGSNYNWNARRRAVNVNFPVTCVTFFYVTRSLHLQTKSLRSPAQIVSQRIVLLHFGLQRVSNGRFFALFRSKRFRLLSRRAFPFPMLSTRTSFFQSILCNLQSSFLLETKANDCFLLYCRDIT